jgi:hypothetical protein
VSGPQVPSGNGGGGNRSTNWEIYQAINDLRRDSEANYASLRGEVRSVRQTLDESLVPKVNEHGEMIESLRARFVYALTVIGSAVGAIVFLYFRGVPPG